MSKSKREKKGGWGGRREGSGRKPGQTLENPRNKNLTFRVSAKTLGQVRQLRELTRDDEMDFNRMFIAWVDEMAENYGL